MAVATARINKGASTFRQLGPRCTGPVSPEGDGAGRVVPIAPMKFAEGNTTRNPSRTTDACFNPLSTKSGSPGPIISSKPNDLLVNLGANPADKQVAILWHHPQDYGGTVLDLAVCLRKRRQDDIALFHLATSLGAYSGSSSP